MPPLPRPTPAFVGREAETAELGALLESGLRGRGGLAVVAGEPGIGKTWLVRHALEGAEADGFDVRWAFCSDSVGAPAYGPWCEAFGDRLRVDAEADRYERVHAAARRVREACRGRPAVVVIDDLQWADVDSVLLLDALVPGLEQVGLVVFATLRDVGCEPSAPRELAALSRHRQIRRIGLRGFPEEQTARYVASIRGRAPAGAELRALQRATAGNPYFLDEVVRQPELPLRGAAAEGWVPTGGIEALIAQRLTVCDAATRQLLELAAVVGPTFSFPQLQRLAASAGEPVPGLEAIDRAVALRLVEGEETSGHFGFVHGLVQEIVLRGLAAERAARLHGRLGELLEADGASGRNTARLAHHFARASALSEYTERAVHHSWRAGYEAAVQQAHALAARHYRNALAALRSLGSSAERVRLRVELLLALGHALAASASLREAADAIDEALEIVESRPSGEAGWAALAFALGVLIRCEEFGPEDPRECRVLRERGERALAGLPEGDTALRSRLLAALPPLFRVEQAGERPAELTRDAVRVAEACGDAAAQNRALEAVHWMLVDGTSGRERLAVATDLAERAERAGDRRCAANARFWRYLDLLELGRADDAEAELSVLEETARALDEPRRIHQALYLRAGLELHRGALDRAETLAEEALAWGRRFGVSYAPIVYRGVLLRTSIERGQTERLRELGPLDVEASNIPPTDRGSPLVRLRLGRRTSALEALADAKRRGLAAIPAGPDWLPGLHAAAWGAAELDDLEACELLYPVLRPYAGRFAVHGLGAATGSISRIVAKLAAKLGRHEEADSLFAAGLADVERAGARCELAWLHFEHVGALLAQGAAKDDERVVAGLHAAAALASELRLSALLGRIRALDPELVEAASGSLRLEGRFSRHGERWLIALGTHACELPDSNGLRFIAALLARPGEELPATDLVAELTGEVDVPLERARQRVTQRIRAALGKLRTAHPEVAAHLGTYLRTGYSCSYLPHASARVHWVLS
jgi:hypothetical protein